MANETCDSEELAVVNPCQESGAEPGELATSERLQFIEWLATPRSLRKPKRQAALARKLGVRPETLSRWKRKTDLTMAVFQIVRDRYLDRVPNIVDAVVKKAEGGDVPAARAVLGLIFGLGDRVAAEFTQNNLTVNLGTPGPTQDDDDAEMPSWWVEQERLRNAGN